MIAELLDLTESLSELQRWAFVLVHFALLVGLPLEDESDTKHWAVEAVDRVLQTPREIWVSALPTSPRTAP